MYPIIRITLFFSCLLFSSICFGQSFKNEVDSIYNFSPKKLSKAEQEKKVPALDKFWTKVTSDTTLYLPKLRTELKAQDHYPYFYFDGSSLLLSLSKSFSDQQLAADAIAKSDIKDIERGQYVRVLNLLANNGVNVTKAAMKILADVDFGFYVPEHALAFDQSMSLAYILLPEKSEWYIDSLIVQFKDANPKTQISILSVLFYAYTCKGDAFIKDAINDNSLSKDVRKTAKEMMSDIKLSKDESDYVKEIGKNGIEDLRKKALQRFSDEAIEELALATKVLRKSVPCR